MRTHGKLLAAVAALGMTASVASAQSIGGTSTSGSSSSGSGSNGSGTGTGLQTSLEAVQTAPPITGVSAYATGGATTNSAINQSNFLRGTFGSVYYQGRAGAQATDAPGGFGQVLYGTTGGTGGGNIGFAANTGGIGGTGGISATTTTGGRTGTTGGLGGTTGGIGGMGGLSTGGLGGRIGATTGGLGGRTGGAVSSATVGGQIVPMARPISYQGVLKFQPPPMMPAQLHADIRGMIDRSTMIANPRNVDIQLDNGGVILRGNAQDEDEARMIEGMVRLTPGVQYVTNQLSYPRP